MAANKKPKQTTKPKKHAKPTVKVTPSIKPIINQWAGKVLAGVIATAYALALYAAVDINLLPTKYTLPIVIASLVIVLAMVIVCVRYTWHSVAKSIVLVLCSIVVLLTNGYVYSVSKSTSEFLADVQSGEYALEPYSIVTKNDYNTTLKTSATISYLADDSNNTAVLDTVSGKTKASQKPSPELASLTVALDDKTADTLVLRSSLLPLLEQNYPSFYQNLNVLETFTVKSKVVANTKKTDISKPYAVFIGGIDTYGEIASVSRSDVNILAIINPKTNKVLLINTPRDYYVQLHDTTGPKDKLTHAGIYGIDMSRQTLEDLYGSPIDYSVRINFTSLLKIVDAIGGVRVYSDNAFKSGSYTFVKGYNNLDSKQALEFSRTRKAFENGDRTRGQNQQRVIEAIIAKVNDPRSLLKYKTIVKSLGDSFQTNANKEEIAALLKQQMNSLGSWEVESISAEGADSRNVTYSMGNRMLYVMEPNIESLNAARATIKEYFK